MQRALRRARRVLAVLAVTAAGFVASPSATAARPQPPNVLMIVLDDARIDTMPVLAKTRDWVAKDGTCFPEAVATTPSCGPSRATLLSGRYPHNHGVLRQDAIGAYDHGRTLQHELSAAGYQTAAVGKLFNTWPISKRPPGFDHWALQTGGYADALFNVDGHGTRAPYATRFVADQVSRYIDGFAKDSSRPWFIWAGFTAPHSPYTPEPRYAHRDFPWGGNPAVAETDRGDKPDYVHKYSVSAKEGKATRTAQLRTLLSADDAIDELHDHLADRGLLDDTLVVFLSDNGKVWGEHGLGSKFTPYQPSYRVPLCLSWPGHVAARTDNRLAATLDVTPTVLDATGIRPGYTVDGHSLLGSRRRAEILLEYWKDSANGSYPTWSSTYRPGQDQYTEYVDGRGRRTGREFYDLARDPWQLTNLLGDRDAGNDPATGTRADELAAARRCAGEQCA
ncbi:arylsulfatase A-like enzyme [Allocatelliglobosispora scoriae]|uniref:Arylsulfatase A-like enzyme n=1 Tax=Allocatelliglobosispora scoriae TaxID=643052 RepID=A0A841BLW6_9ACTN|nr:sulfatase-like hydrolase/transferase [Allocatelliglobosispora scoriae]MBB5868246.1 arylsulfatase A-like enzyme [Allocatelliglobosispora scoriae]